MPYFNISMGKSAISLLIRREFLNYLNTLQGKDKFPGRATIKADSLEKHQYSEAINPKRFKSKYAQKLAVKREHDRKSAHETAARTELLLGDDAGFIEGDSDDEFTGRYIQHIPNSFIWREKDKIDPL